MPLKKRSSTHIIFIRIILLAGVTFLAACNDNSVSSAGDANKPSPNRLNVGESAHDLLSADYHTKLIVEFQYVVGYRPTSRGVDSLLSFIHKYLNKPDGISVVYDSIPAPGKGVFSIADIKNIEDQNRTQFNSGKTLAVYFFFANGTSAEDSKSAFILGEAYRNTSLVVYERSIETLTSSFPTRSRATLEAIVMRHEFGHDLGLVNLGTPMVNDHEDPNHVNHCKVPSCLMYWDVNTSDVVGNLRGGVIPQLDPYCRADLKANGGK